MKPTTDDGFLVQSWEYDDISSSEARTLFSERAESEWFGHKKVNYKLRDWLFSRQRYWWEPIPLIHISHADFDALPRISETSEATNANIAYILDKRGTDKRCRNCTCGDVWCVKLIIAWKTFSRVYDGINGKIIIDSRLPLTLPEVEKYEPAGDGQSPLATVSEWVNVKLADNLSWKRETNTMPQWWGSCWYYLRYMDSKNAWALAWKEALEYWQNVDEYVGGAEHAVLHLLYARFWHKVLYDIGVVPTLEPFQKLTNVGMILAYAYERWDGGLVAVDLVEEKWGKYFEIETQKEVKQVVAKMSKSLKNVVNPNDIVTQYGADTLRLYEMSMSGFTDTAPWNPDAIVGVRRFLDKAYSAFTEGKNITKDDMKAMKLLHKTVKKVGEDIIAYKFNTAISALMILLNEWIPTDEEFALEWKEKFATLLHPFAPHMAEELFSYMDNSGSIYDRNWPDYDDFMLVDDEVTIAVQVNGKLRGTLTCLNGVMQEEVSSLAHENPDIMKWVEGKTLVKEIFIPNKMLSIVVKE
jgi:leucyl-tRNA synthetase